MTNKIQLTCVTCNNIFSLSKRHHDFIISGKRIRSLDLCKKCINIKNINNKKKLTHVTINCDECNKSISKNKNNLKNTNFCNKKCSLKYLNKQNILNKKQINEKRSNTLKILCSKVSYCKQCNITFEGSRNFCTPECRHKAIYTPEQRLKISKSLKGKTGGLRDGGGHSKVYEYINIHKHKMYLNLSEIEVAKILDNLNLNWNRNSKGFKYTTLLGINRKYYPDFYLSDFDLYVEYKGFVTPEMIHKMKDAQNKNNMKLLIIYSDDKRYNHLGLNLKTITENNNIIFDYIK